jgi:hypothetical protein
VAFWQQDREMAPDIAAAKALVQKGVFRPLTELSLLG